MDTPDADQTRTLAGERAPALSLGQYKLAQRLGEGGMGEVWLAQQTAPVKRQVAVKILKPGMDSVRVIARFETERQTLAVMDHPAIARMFDAGTTPEGRPYFVMEYVRGESIVAYCDRQRVSLPARLELFIQLCEGVQHAHQKGIIHRDLKPSNVLIALVDDRPVPRIIDFGIAKAMAQLLTDGSSFTELGAFVGTPEYMSPEQAAMTSDIDTRSDVYSLGLLLYELLVGGLPFDRATFRQQDLDGIRRTIRETDAPRPSARVKPGSPDLEAVAQNRQTASGKLGTLLRGDLDWIVMKALEKDRARRYATANALALDIRRHLDHEPVSAGPPGAAYRARKFVRRHRVGVTAIAAVGVLVIAFAVVMAVQARRIARERDRANQEAATAKQVSDFLVGLFKVSDPSEARGNSLTAREILTRGSTRLRDDLRDQPQVQARLQSTIGTVFSGLGLYADAQQLLEQALRTRRSALGEDHAETLATAHSLADVYWYLGDYAAAEPLYADIVARRTKTLGPDDPATMKAEYDLMSLYLLRKRWADFERVGPALLARQRRVLGDAHMQTLDSLTSLQYFYYQTGRYAEAEPIAAEVYAGRRRVLGEDHPDSLASLHNLATIVDALGRYSEAEGLYLRTLAGKRRVQGEEHPDTCRTWFRLAGMYIKQRRYDEAERASLSAYRGFFARLGADNELTSRSAEQLASIYDATGRPRDAEQWRLKVVRK